MKLHVAIVLSLLATARPAVAEDIFRLFGAEVALSSVTLQGYIVVHDPDKVDLAKPEALAILKQYPTMWLYEDLRATATIPGHGRIHFLMKPKRIIKTSEIRSIKQHRMPLDGREHGMMPPVVSANQARLLAKPPLAFCVGNVGLYWFSYSKKVDQDRLEEVCKASVDRDALNEELKFVAKHPNVFSVQMEGGD